MSRYPQCRLLHLGIDNIHVVREALAAMRATVLEESAKSLHTASSWDQVRPTRIATFPSRCSPRSR